MMNSVCGTIHACEADSRQRQPPSVLTLLRLLLWIARYYLVRGVRPIVAAFRRLEHALWIARYYLVLSAGGLYTGFMLLEHYEGASYLAIDWLFKVAGGPLSRSI